MKMFLLSLIFTTSVFAQTFVCNQQNFIAKFNAPKSDLKAAYDIAMFGLLEKWFNKVKLQPNTVNSFQVKMVPQGNRNDAVVLQFQASVATVKGVTYQFKLTEQIFVTQGHDPLNNSIFTCGPMAGLPISFWLEVFDAKGSPVDKMLHDYFWGSNLCYKYTLSGRRN